ncbi:hypothetical protein DICPUDRAFT_54421 [Dictyostelium purpureum]|uniref:Phospholipid/glycerol acyltransferase domain-containing protein n=1 Tax=Dictyostelium purpureum TaxID=5786 RepID=F0ZGZ2_DICPU|nr:uncharacterized protein DICPUDRAFT_54421 [Dictyostelium purpureum]EGC36799.1 hypothetical protein DICPUDRAFT_54421 [Dictyostelium purpureum]|eukprot:XP_003286670.1 hypothetical protein DICPUDRAFT_54421 [Dictyostelium purpureum]
MVVISNFYEGKNVLITGSTGFVGKVLLEKMVRDLPGIQKIYIIIRGNAKERFIDDIIGSRIWDLLKAKLGGEEEFNKLIHNKVVPVSGDLSKEGLGLSPEDTQTIIDNVNVIIHCAASIDFRERLDKAIQSNLYASLNMLDLSRKLRNIKAYVHCSTAYVNSNREGWLDEELPVLDFNPEEMVDLIMKQDIQTLERITPNLLGAYPNTYTFTKAITERILALKRGDVPLCFVRPTIVGGSLKEPVPGWVDSVAAIGAVMLYCGVGLVQFMKGDGRMVADIVPVDHVANALIAAAVSMESQNSLKIFQIGTSHRNPVLWNRISHYVTEYWRSHTPKKSVARSSFSFHSHIMYEAHFFMKYGIPSALLQVLAVLTGSEDTKTKAEGFKKITKAARLICDTFKHFTGHEWVFSVQTLEKIFQDLFDGEDRIKFNCDAAEINWQSYFCYFCYGLHKYVIKEEGVRPPTELLNTSIITKSEVNQSGFFQWVFADISWASTSYRHVTQTPLPPRAPTEIRSLVMNSPRVQQAMEKVSREEGVLVSEIEKRASQIMDRMQSNLNIMVVRVLGWFLKKVWRKIYQGIHVDEKGIELIREAIKKSPVVLIPSHRSYIDFLIISYIFFEYNLPLPHIAAGEDFLSIIIVRWFFRNAGAFFLRRTFHGDSLYWAIFSEYVQRLVIDNQPMEFFIEGKRSRTGKSLHPKMGLLSMVCQPYFENRVQDVHIVPIGISYEKVLEGELYSNELMGESKTKESLNGLLRASKVLKMNFGRINVVFTPPISVKQYTEQKVQEVASQRHLPAPALPAPSILSTPASIAPPSSTKNSNISEGDFEINFNKPDSRATGAIYDPFNNNGDRRSLISDLGYQIVRDLNKSIIITTTSVVATILLSFRRGINREELITKVEWLREEIFARGGDVAFEGPSDALVDHSLKLISNLVSKRRNMYEPGSAQLGVTNKNYRKNVLVLNFYRNQLLHLFLWDGLVSLVILSILQTRDQQSNENILNTNNVNNKQPKDTVSEETIICEVRFLAKVLSIEFVNQPGYDTDEFIKGQINRMAIRGIINKEQTNEQTFYGVKSEGACSFFANLFYPLVEGYLSGILTLFSIQPEMMIKKNQFLQRMGWFAEKMFEEGKSNFYESCSMEILGNSLQLFEQMKVIQRKKLEEQVGKRTTRSSNGNKKQQKKPTRRERKQEPEEYIRLLPPYQDKDGLLKELTERLSKYKKSPQTKHQLNDLRRTVVEDFPLLSSKL